METEKILFALLRYELCGAELPEEIKTSIAPESLRKVYRLSIRHDLSHLIIDALDKNGLLLLNEEDKEQAMQKCQLAVFRFEQLDFELKQISRTLENAQIDHIPLKGSVIRLYYPEPWMRTSCDIDVLVKEEDLERAVQVLQEELRYSHKGNGDHDAQLYSEGGVHLELHYRLLAKKEERNASSIISQPWQHATACGNCAHRMEFSKEFFYLYHIEHMAKHFQIGGCGIRPFLDIWILKRFFGLDQAKTEKLLSDAQLLTFAKTAEQVSEVWFSGAEGNELTKNVEKFVFRGGVYGSTDNRIALQHVKKGGKKRYILSRIFMPYQSLKQLYPVLEKHKWLMPFCQVRRWCNLLFNGRLKKSVQEWKISDSISESKQQATAKLLQQLGL